MIKIIWIGRLFSVPLHLQDEINLVLQVLSLLELTHYIY